MAFPRHNLLRRKEQREKDVIRREWSKVTCENIEKYCPSDLSFSKRAENMLRFIQTLHTQCCLSLGSIYPLALNSLQT